MTEATETPLVEQITAQLHHLSAEDLRTVQDFVAYLAWKRSLAARQPKSAEARAIERMQDVDDPTKWITVIDEGEEVDINKPLQRLSDRGYPVEIPRQDP